MVNVEVDSDRTDDDDMFKDLFENHKKYVKNVSEKKPLKMKH